MSSLYGRLFTYREKAKQAPLENYLTEALCDLLNRDPEKQRELLKELRLFEWEDTASLHFETQVPVKIKNEARQLDLVGYIGDIPVLVIEVKINAEFTAGQLPAYGTWLAAEAREGGREDAVLALLTYKTSTPEDFKNGDGYAVKTRVVHWRDVRRELKALQSSGSSTYLALAEEFANFLDEQGVTMEAPKKEDFDKLSEYVQSGTAVRWQNFMNDIRERLKKAVPKHLKLSWEADTQLQAGGAFVSTADALTGWVNISDRYSKKGSEILYISWGFYFAPKGNADPFGFHEFFQIPRGVHGVYLNMVHREPQNSPGDKQENDWFPLLPGKVGTARKVAFKALEPADFEGDAAKLGKWLEKHFEQVCKEVDNAK